ncbi:MAG: serine/threonine-protein kinase [Polyangiaceae bacterium]
MELEVSTWFACSTSAFYSSNSYIVLEHLVGTDLRAHLQERGGKLPVPLAVDLVLQACVGLAEAHGAGIVHRDLKPQNLFLTTRKSGAPSVKILDFGVSKLDSRSGSLHELTATDVLIGSPAFVSPEQIRDARTVDERADVWSLGVVLYMLVGGGKPFDGESVGALCASIVVDPPHPLRARVPGVPEGLEAVILRCLEKKRDARTPNVAALAAELAPFASTDGRAAAGQAAALYVPHASVVAEVTSTRERPLGAADAALVATATASAPARTSEPDGARVDRHDVDPTGSETTRTTAERARARRGILAGALFASAVAVAFFFVRLSAHGPAHADAAPATLSAEVPKASAAPSAIPAPTTTATAIETSSPLPSATPSATPTPAPVAAPATNRKRPPARPNGTKPKRPVVDKNGVPILD